MNAIAKRYPTIVAALIYALLIAVIFWPFWQGNLLMSSVSDQVAGYSFRAFAATHFKTVGGFPLWNPYIFGGMPFLQNTTNGDTFYPTAFLRLLMPVGTAMALGFLVHIVLAGAFTFKFLRALGLRIESSFIGGLAYMLTGMVISQVSPGHDGKLFVSALTPLALNFLFKAVTRSDWRQYVYFGAVVGFSFLTPHYQMTYYMLMAAGFFWLFLNFFDEPGTGRAVWYKSFGWFVAALLLGFAIDAVQMAPFAHYIGSTGRAAAGSSSTGYAYATSYAMPIEETLNILWPSFSGYLQTYWGQNHIKLHSEYIGGVVLILATLGFRLRERKRLAWFFAFLAIYATLFSFGGHTPFYYIPYAILPGIKLTRAPGQIFFLASLAAAVFAGFGVEYLYRARERREVVGKGPFIAWGVILVGGALLALGGGFASMIESMAPPEYAELLPEISRQLSFDALRVLALGGVAIGVLIAFSRAKIPGNAAFVALTILLGLDLWSVEKRYINWLPPEQVTFAPDQVARTLRQDTTVFRVLINGIQSYQYGWNYLATQRIREVLGYQGTELHRYDELMGGKGQWKNIGNPAVLRLVTAKYLVIGQALPPNPMLTQIGAQALSTNDGGQAYLYRFNANDPYSYVVPTAVKIADEQALAVISDPRSGFDPRKAILVPADSRVGLDPKDVRALAPADSTPVTVERSADDVIRLSLGKPATANSYLFVSENYYPDWRATVDGKAADVLRAQFSLMAVPLTAGARSVELRVAPASYGTFRWVTFAALALVLATAVSGPLMRSRKSNGV